MLTINLDYSEIAKLAAGLEGQLQEAARKAGAELAPAVHAKVLELANQKLHGRRQKFIDGLSFKQEGDTYFIVLDKKARWIDDGIEPHEMIDDLLSSRGGKGKGPQRAADGSTYRVIPFFHGPGKGATTNTPAEATLQQTIKAELKKADNKLTGGKGIPYGKLERGADGQPLTGLLHSMDIEHSPIKTHSGPGMGWGNIGAVRQGYTGIPFLRGVRIYQRMTKNPDGSSSVKRAVMTFRIVSSKHKGTGRWFHPGLKPVFIFEEAHEWGMKQWDNVILPKIADFIMEKKG